MHILAISYSAGTAAAGSKPQPRLTLPIHTTFRSRPAFAQLSSRGRAIATKRASVSPRVDPSADLGAPSSSGSGELRVGVAALQGPREDMEDMTQVVDAQCGFLFASKMDVWQRTVLAAVLTHVGHL